MSPESRVKLVRTLMTSAVISCALSAFFAWWGTEGEKFWNSFWSGWAMAFPLASTLSLILQGPIGRLAERVAGR